jgi:hypothetical protein
MEIVLFVSFIAVCAFVVILASSKSKKRANPSQERKERLKTARKDLLRTPVNYTLSRPDQSWHTRRNSATTGVTRTNAFVARSLGQDPEYDGYSRRDRHHVRDRTARVKTESHVEEPRMSSIEYKKSQGVR